VLTADLTRRFDPSPLGHLHVHEDDVRVQRGDAFDHLEPVGRLADDLHVGLHREDLDEAATEQRVIVRDEDAYGLTAAHGIRQVASRPPGLCFVDLSPRRQPMDSMSPRFPSRRR
jgi:hypothetical protein